jgi:hypothetical protein
VNGEIQEKRREGRWGRKCENARLGNCEEDRKTKLRNCEDEKRETSSFVKEAVRKLLAWRFPVMISK